MSSKLAPAFRVVEIPGKGKGLVANRFLLRGSLIISEVPIIPLPRKMTTMAQLQQLIEVSDPSVAATLMSFPGSNDPGMMLLSRMQHFLPLEGSELYQQGLFEIICRANHSCRPNANYFWNNTLGREVLHAIVDIPVGTEIEVSYVDEETCSGDLRDHLKSEFGFTCTCPSCVRPAQERRRSAARIRDYLAFVAKLPTYFGTKPPLWILDEIERQTVVACEEGFSHSLGQRCHDAFQLCAFYGDAKHAEEWEAISRDMHILRTGKDAPAAENAARLARDPQKFRAWGQLGSRVLRGPSDEIKALALPVSGPLNVPRVSETVLISEEIKPLTKGQKKLAREKRRKAESKEQL